MVWVKKAAIIICALLIVIGIWAESGKLVFAQDVERATTIIVEEIEYEWWLLSWSSNQVLCQIFTNHEGLPTLGEVAASCGDELANLWHSSPPCNKAPDCSGLYVHMVSAEPRQVEIIIEMPPPLVWVELEGCDPIPPENLCVNLPLLVLKGEEPLPDERITAIQGTFDGAPFYCAGEICKLALRPTTTQGSTIEFWADSSFGDSSARFTAHIRVVDTGFSAAPDGGGYYVDIISTQFKGAHMASCARIWEAFSPIGGPPTWLSTPERHELIGSENPYYYLAGRLIAQGLIDSSSCPSGGLLPNGYADACGLEKARPLVEEWQNKFDARIIEAANETGIPAQLMKNLFAQESQFWPGVFRVPYEFGLGQITDNGADTILLWNQDFYDQFCPLVLSPEACERGYLGLEEDQRLILRGALALQAKSDCPECPEGVDLTNVDFTVLLFANTLQANCAQVSRTVYTATEQMAGRVSSYEDLWRFTIANYHAGPGCTSYAIHQAWQNAGDLTWANVANNFTEPCKGVVPYVEKISQE